MTDTMTVAISTAHIPAVADLEDLAQSATAYAMQSKSANTRRAYKTDWADFTSWCDDHDLASLPAAPQSVSLYLADRADILKVSTLQRRLTAVSQAHQGAGEHLDTRHPAIKETWAGIKRVHGTAQKGKAPVVTADVRAMVATLDDKKLIGIRDRALLLVGFAGALRRSELVGLDVGAGQPTDGQGYVEFTSDGLIVTLTRSKADQEGQGAVVGVPYGSVPSTCPVRALKAWLAASGIEEGPIFRGITRHGRMGETRLTNRVVALVVKRTVKAAQIARGADPAAAEALARDVAGHSLRAGLVTSAAARGETEGDIMRQTRHKRADTMRKYVRLGSLFERNVAARVGL
jgi:integrase